MLLAANKAINAVHQHLAKIMQISSKYGAEMGSLGKMISHSGEGATMARKMSEMLVTRAEPGDLRTMLQMIQDKAINAGMSKTDLSKVTDIMKKIEKEALNPENHRAVRKVQWGTYDKADLMRKGDKLGLL